VREIKRVTRKRGGIMKRLKMESFLVMTGLASIVCLWFVGFSHAQDQHPVNPPDGIYIKLTRDFYEALKGEGGARTKVYTNDPSIEYLRQIAISSKFMVETNLQIMRQQARIIQLLEAQAGGK
jgi:hypothetical protein